MDRKLLIAGMLVSGFIFSLSRPGLLQAQSHAVGAPEQKVVCMERVTNKGPSLSILTPSISAEAMEAKGFEIVPCSRKFATQEQQEKWRDSICQIAASWRPDLQDHFELTRGERPAVLCGMAEMAIGQWTKGGTQ